MNSAGQTHLPIDHATWLLRAHHSEVYEGYVDRLFILEARTHMLDKGPFQYQIPIYSYRNSYHKEFWTSLSALFDQYVMEWLSMNKS